MVVYLGKATPASGTGGGSGGNVDWGNIGGTLSDQTDLQTALNAKQDLIDSTHKLSASLVEGLATVATSGSYADLTNKPTSIESVDNQNTASGATTPLKLWEGTEAQWNVGGGVDSANSYKGWVNDTTITFPKMVTSGSNDFYPRKIFKLNGKWFGTGMGYGNYINYNESFLISSDGVTFTSAGIGVINGNTIAYGASKYVALPNTGIYYSSDAVTWEYIVGGDLGISGIGSNTWFNGTPIYANGKFIFACYATNGSYNAIVTSTDGVNWTVNTVTLPTGYFFTCFMTYLNNMFIAQITDSESSSQNHKIVTSTDGTTWTEVVGGKYPLCYGNGKYLRVNAEMNNGEDYGNVAEIQYSTDLVNWTTLSVTAGDIIFNGTRFAAIRCGEWGEPDVFLTSDDGKNWNEYLIGTAGTYGLISYFGEENKYYLTSRRRSDMRIGAATGLLRNNYLTKGQEVTTASTVYDAPSDTSTLTITAVDSENNTITLSDTVTYTSDSNYDTNSYYSVGQTYPTWLCNIEGVGVKIGNTMIADYSAPAIGDIDTALTAIIAQGS